MTIRLALEKSRESHGKVRYRVFKAQFTKTSFYFWMPPFWTEKQDPEHLQH